MASFLDQPYKFNQFIQTTPVEDMVKVGMIKQDQYNQGVQKIQGWIEEVASLPVAREVDKSYLQSLLNNTGEQLQKVSAADFSKNQLLQSVSGMVSAISRDPNVLAAVQSSDNIKKQSLYIEEAKKKGELTPDNHYHYLKQLNGYMGSQELGQVFNGQYTPHFDIDKFARETFKDVLPDGMTIDQVYVTDASGKIVLDKQGRPTYSPTMTRLEKEGRFPAKVKETIEHIFSDPRVNTQLQITGEYNYRGATPEAMASMLRSQRDQQIGSLEEKVRELTLEKKLNPTAGVDAQIEAMQQGIQQIKGQYDQSIATAMENPDAIRGMLHRNQVRDNFTTMYGQEKTKSTIHSNPGWDANFKMIQEANEVRYKNSMLNLQGAQLELAKSKFAWDMKYDVMKLETDLAKATLKGSKVKDGDGNPIAPKTDFMPSDLQLSTFLQEKYVTSASQYASATDELIFSSVLDSPTNRAYIKKLTDQGKTREQALDQLIKNGARQNGEPADQYRERWRNKAISRINSMPPTMVDESLKNAVNGAIITQNNFLAAKAEINEIDRLQAVQTGIPGNTLADLSSLKNVSIKVGDNNVTFTPEDLFNINQFRNGTKEQRNIAQANLQAAGKFEAYSRAVELDRASSTQLGGAPKSPRLTPVLNEAAKIGQLYSDDNNKRAMAARAAILQSKWNLQPNLRLGLMGGKEEYNKGVLNDLATTIANYAANKQNASPDFDAEALLAVVHSKSPVKNIELKTSKHPVTGEITPTIVFADENGKRVGSMVVTREEANSLGANVDQFYQADNVQKISNRLSLLGNGTTSMSGDIDSIGTYLSGDAAFQHYDFPNLQNTGYDVKANVKVENVRQPSGQTVPVYYTTMYINDGERQYLAKLPAAQTLEQVVLGLEKVNSTHVQAVIADEKKKKR